MNANDYQQKALRTMSWVSRDGPYPIRTEALLDGLMGLNGEAGECIDILKKHLFQFHPLDKEHLAEELGDVAWYLAVSADALGYKLDDIFEMNIRKLELRYPDGFDPEKSINRKEYEKLPDPDLWNMDLSETDIIIKPE